MAPHFSILAWRIPWAEEPGALRIQGRRESDMSDSHFHAPGLSLVVASWGSSLVAGHRLLTEVASFVAESRL